jgi:hypothetical protein
VFSSFDDTDRSYDAQTARSLVRNTCGILVLVMIIGRAVSHLWYISRSLTDKKESRTLVIPEQAWNMFDNELKETLGVAFSAEFAARNGALVMSSSSLVDTFPRESRTEILAATDRTFQTGYQETTTTFGPEFDVDQIRRSIAQSRSD